MKNIINANPVGFPKPTLISVNGDRDTIAKSANLAAFVPNVEVVSLDCGHWIQEEKPEETNQVISKWLKQQDAN